MTSMRPHSRPLDRDAHDQSMRMGGEEKPMKMTMGWGRFAATIATSTVASFFLMYQLIYSADHFTFSMNHLVSAFVMSAVMAVIMLGFMWSMFEGPGLRVAVLLGSVVLGIALLLINRGQILINDTRFLKSMIPHHSIAINNARKAAISDPRVRRVADEIIASQVREIREMQLLIDDIERNGPRGSTPLPARPAVVTPDMQPKIRAAVQ